MEPQGQQTSQQSQPNDNQAHTPSPAPHTSQKKLIIIIIILVIIIVGAGGYILGKQTQPNNSQNQVTPSPTQQLTNVPSSATTPSAITPPTDSGIPLTENTVSFTRVNGVVYMKYKGKIYSEEAANKNDASLTNLPNPNSYTWYGLVDAPAVPADAFIDELFDFKVFPDKYNFVFIMRWPTASETQFKIFLYDAYKPDNKVTNVYTSIWSGSGNAYKVPRINQLSPDGYAAFHMFGCWNCGGHAPEVLLLNLTTKTTKNIGKVSYFNWKENGNYEYKAYVVISCTIDGPGECSEDPNNLPLLTGSF